MSERLDCPKCGVGLPRIRRLPCLRPCSCGARWKVTATGDIVASTRRLPSSRVRPKKTKSGRLPGRPLKTKKRTKTKPPKKTKRVATSASPRKKATKTKCQRTINPVDIDMSGWNVEDERVVEDGSIAFIDSDGFVLAAKVGLGSGQSVPPTVYTSKPPPSIVRDRVAIPVRACAFYFEIGTDDKPRCFPIPRGYEAWRSIFGDSDPRRRVLSDFPSIFARSDRGLCKNS